MKKTILRTRAARVSQTHYSQELRILKTISGIIYYICYNLGSFRELFIFPFENDHNRSYLWCIQQQTYVKKINWMTMNKTSWVLGVMCS